MLYANNKFKMLKLTEKWEAPTKEEEKLLAIETRVDSKMKIFEKKKKSSTTSKKKTKESTNEEIEKKRKIRKEKPAWMFARPETKDLKKSREFNGKQWWYCSHETGGKCSGLYRLHKPSECKGTARNNKKADESPKKKVRFDKNKPSKRYLKLARAMMAQMGDSGDSEGDLSE